ncbi:myosin-13 isoform X3 [Camellia sinensis]|uniref:myosin-13 isoform X3 n=1 Tax=Camellia sinensis TaxID=4442 RepID=UPI001036D496|nr:myosin-13 isoform X3 [Camellia sinensis]
MELLKLSKFKLQLRALVTEVRELREREQSSTEQLNLLIQKQKQIEEEFGRKLTELQAELALSNELRQKLERKVSYLQSDNALLENKQKELKGTINNLLQSRESFVKVYEDSTFEMKQSIQTSDRKVTILSQKINAHLLLFDSIEKEAFSVKQVLDNVQHLVSEKEGIVAGLKSKMDKLSSYEKVFVEKISDLESKLRNDENELRRKEKVISQLEAQLEEAKISNFQPQMEEFQKTLSTKDVIIQNLLTEKKALQLELRSLGIILQKIQDTVTNMNEEDRRAFSSVLGGQKECTEIKEKENIRIEDAYQNTGENSPSKAGEGGSEENTASVYKEHDSVNKRLQGNNNMECCISEPTYSEPQSTPNVVSIAVTEAKDNCTTLVYHQNFESSTTQAETSNDPVSRIRGCATVF